VETTLILKLGVPGELNIGTDIEAGYSNSVEPTIGETSNSSIICDIDVSPFGPENREGLEFLWMDCKYGCRTRSPLRGAQWKEPLHKKTLFYV